MLQVHVTSCLIEKALPHTCILPVFHHAYEIRDEDRFSGERVQKRPFTIGAALYKRVGRAERNGLLLRAEPEVTRLCYRREPIRAAFSCVCRAKLPKSPTGQARITHSRQEPADCTLSVVFEELSPRLGKGTVTYGSNAAAILTRSLLCPVSPAQPQLAVYFVCQTVYSCLVPI